MSGSSSTFSVQIRSIITQIDSNIKSLQQFLDNDVNNSLSTQQRTDILNRITDLENIKTSLLPQLLTAYGTFETNADVSNDVLNKQILALKIIQDETDKTTRQINLLNSEKPDKIKLAGINSYYSKKYNSHKQIMKTIVLVCIPIIILSILGNKGLIPNTIVVLLNSAMIIFGVITVGYQIIDISNRDKMNYDAYDWKFNKSNAPSATPSAVGAEGDPSNPWNYQLYSCYGSDCCTEGSTTWDAVTKKCIPIVASSS